MFLFLHRFLSWDCSPLFYTFIIYVRLGQAVGSAVLISSYDQEGALSTPPPAVFLVHAFVSFLTFRLRQRSAIFILFFFYETPFRHAGYPSLRSQFIASVALNTATGGRCVASLLPSPTRGAICPHFSGLSDTPCVIVCPYSELDYRCSACVPMACPACSPLRVSSSPSSLSGR